MITKQIGMKIVFFSYRTTYKVVISYMPYQLVYVLHPIMPIEYVLLASSGDHINANHV